MSNATTEGGGAQTAATQAFYLIYSHDATSPLSVRTFDQLAGLVAALREVHVKAAERPGDYRAARILAFHGQLLPIVGTGDRALVDPDGTPHKLVDQPAWLVAQDPLKLVPPSWYA